MIAPEEVLAALRASSDAFPGACSGSMWGSSFLFISVGLKGLRPGLISRPRLLVGAAVLAIPGLRERADRPAWPWLILLGVVWMSLPSTLFAVTQQWVASSVGGMMNGGGDQDRFWDQISGYERVIWAIHR